MAACCGPIRLVDGGTRGTGEDIYRKGLPTSQVCLNEQKYLKMQRTCTLHDTARNRFWPQMTSFKQKLYGSETDLNATRAVHHNYRPGHLKSSMFIYNKEEEEMCSL